jgi:invasion protein IalB
VKHVLAGFAIIAIAAATPSFAQIEAQPQQPAAAAKPSDAGQMICEKQVDTGSRLSSHKICHTRSQWEQLRRDDRSELERVQMQRPMTQDGH